MAGSETKSGAASGVGSGLVTGTITDSVGNVFNILPVAKETPPIDVDEFRESGPKRSTPHPVVKDSTAQWFSGAPFSLVFDTSPDSQAPQKIFFQATKAPFDRRWLASVDFNGHDVGAEITYKIYSPESKDEIDPSVIIVDPFVFNLILSGKS